MFRDNCTWTTLKNELKQQQQQQNNNYAHPQKRSYIEGENMSFVFSLPFSW